MKPLEIPTMRATNLASDDDTQENSQEKKDDKLFKRIGSFDGLLNFTIGILNGTGFTESDMLENCREAVDDSWFTGFTTLIYHYNAKNPMGVLYQFFNMMNATDAVANACYGGMESAGIQYYNLTKENLKSMQLLLNFGLNFGKIYRDLEGLILYLAPNVPYQGPAADIYDAGYMLGDVLMNILQSPVQRIDTDAS